MHFPIFPFYIYFFTFIEQNATEFIVIVLEQMNVLDKLSAKWNKLRMQLRKTYLHTNSTKNIFVVSNVPMKFIYKILKRIKILLIKSFENFENKIAKFRFHMLFGVRKISKQQNSNKALFCILHILQLSLQHAHWKISLLTSILINAFS